MVEIWTCKQIERVFLGRPVPARPRPRPSGVNHVLHAAGPLVVAGVCSCGGTDDSTTSRRQETRGKEKDKQARKSLLSPAPSVRPSPSLNLTWLGVSTANPTSPTARASVSPPPTPAPALPPGSSSPPLLTTRPSVGSTSDRAATTAPDHRLVLGLFAS